MITNEERRFITSDVNFAAYLAYHQVKLKETNTTHDGGRIRVWFEFDTEDDEFTRHKNDFFSQADTSKVVAGRLFQERERMYSLMIQVRNNAQHGG